MCSSHHSLPSCLDRRMSLTMQMLFRPVSHISANQLICCSAQGERRCASSLPAISQQHSWLLALKQQIRSHAQAPADANYAFRSTRLQHQHAGDRATSRSAGPYCEEARCLASPGNPRRLCALAVLGQPRPETAPPMCPPAHHLAGRVLVASQPPTTYEHLREAHVFHRDLRQGMLRKEDRLASSSTYLPCWRQCL